MVSAVNSLECGGQVALLNNDSARLDVPAVMRTHVFTALLATGIVLGSCVGDQGIQVKVLNSTRTTVTVYEEPREPRADLVLKPDEEFWMILCRRPGIGPCSITLRAITDANTVVFCRKYGQDELSRNPRVIVDNERRC